MKLPTRQKTFVAVLTASLAVPAFAAEQTVTTDIGTLDRVAFSFGLLHGFGFAGALAEVGLPQHAIPVSLLFFNVGVEIGQLVFVAAVLSLIWLLRHAASRRLEATFARRAFDRLDDAIAYGIGVVAAYWLIERTTAFLHNDSCGALAASAVGAAPA
jgi:hypothetical protein